LNQLLVSLLGNGSCCATSTNLRDSEDTDNLLHVPIILIAD